MSTPLAGLKVIEIAGLAPAPFAGKILADFGADVIRVDRSTSVMNLDVLANNKRSIAINLKSPAGIETLIRLIEKADVVIEPFRPGVMERLGLGPDVLLARNPRLVYARMTGFGQTGHYAKMAGHDINYLAISGVLSVRLLISPRSDHKQDEQKLLYLINRCLLLLIDARKARRKSRLPYQPPRRFCWRWTDLCHGCPSRPSGAL